MLAFVSFANFNQNLNSNKFLLILTDFNNYFNIIKTKNVQHHTFKIVNLNVRSLKCSGFEKPCSLLFLRRCTQIFFPMFNLGYNQNFKLC